MPKALRPLLVCVLLLPFAVLANFSQEVAQRLAGGQTVAGQTLHAANLMQRMYQGTEQQPLWDDAAIDDLLTAIDGLGADGLTPADYRFPQLDPLLRARAEGGLSPAEAAELDLLLTEAFARAVYNLYFGKVDAERLDPNINFARAMEDDDPAPELRQAIADGNIAATFDQARPKNVRHQWLKDALARYRQYQAQGGWAPVPKGTTLKPGERAP